MACWLMKSEPDAYSLDDLQREKTAPWDGVRNPTARNNMKKMAKGDPVLFYHSSCKVPAVVGLARVSRTAYPDPTAWDKKSRYFDQRSTPDNPRWEMVDIEFLERFPEEVTLTQIKSDPKFEDMVLVRFSRLSVQPVGNAHFKRILKLGGSTSKIAAKT